MIFGFFVVRPIPHAEFPPVDDETAYRALATEASEAIDPTFRRDSSRTRLLNHGHERDSSEEESRVSLELSPNRPAYPRADSMVLLKDTDVHGKTLFKTFDFWLLVVIMFLREFLIILTYENAHDIFLVSGTGLMCQSRLCLRLNNSK
jgi:hypothetical protein